ncbi:MAG: hypothetical protein LBD03_05835 [Methanobrevibacter sp.]|nr:hypothetical protein [Candidatus Methanovirga procula]
MCKPHLGHTGSKSVVLTLILYQLTVQSVDGLISQKCSLNTIYRLLRHIISTIKVIYLRDNITIWRLDFFYNHDIN